MTVLHPEVPEEEIPGALDRIAGYVAGAGGDVTETLRDSPWGRRRLSYPIRHGGRDIRDGYYTVFHFTMNPSQIVEMEQELKLNTQVIRYLVTSYTPVPIDPRAVEAAEIAAEDAAAAAYQAAQAEAARMTAAANRRPAPAPAPSPAPVSAPAPETAAGDAPAAPDAPTEAAAAPTEAAVAPTDPASTVVDDAPPGSLPEGPVADPVSEATTSETPPVEAAPAATGETPEPEAAPAAAGAAESEES
jgi:ribosomal protein S6